MRRILELRNCEKVRRVTVKEENILKKDLAFHQASNSRAAGAGFFLEI